MANKASLRNFNKGYDERRNLKGQPRKVLSLIMEEMKAQGYERVKSVHVIEAYELLMGMTEAEVLSYSARADVPILLSTTAKQLISDRGAFEALNLMQDRAHGKATQKSELTGADGAPLQVEFNPAALTTDEKRAMLALLDKAKGG